jgi:hypothetical protein
LVFFVRRFAAGFLAVFRRARAAPFFAFAFGLALGLVGERFAAGRRAGVGAAGGAAGTDRKGSPLGIIETSSGLIRSMDMSSP